MISYTDGSDREAIITSAGDGAWTVGVWPSFAAFRACEPAEETRTFPGTPNRRAMLSAWPGWMPRVRNDSDWALMPDSSDDLPELTAIPISVTARQIRLWLVQNGIALSAIETAIDAIPDQQTREIVRVEWEYAPYVERTHPWLVPLAQALGLNEEQVDQAFREASQI
jgi:hypothetical protein